jgi:hypothetical protein
VIGGGAVVDPEAVGTIVVDAVRAERFLVLTHPEMAEFVQRKTTDWDRWVRGMQRLSDRGRKLLEG